jgi:hypothetical protein
MAAATPLPLFRSDPEPRRATLTLPEPPSANRWWRMVVIKLERTIRELRGERWARDDRRADDADRSPCSSRSAVSLSHRRMFRSSTSRSTLGGEPPGTEPGGACHRSGEKIGVVHNNPSVQSW